jgi:hypothetical protein
MEEEIKCKRRYANVTRDVLNLFKEKSEECQLKKRKIASKGIVVKPLLSKDCSVEDN